MSPEMYLEWLDQTEITRPYQSIILMGIFHKEVISTEAMLKQHGHKLNEHALWAMRLEVARLYHAIMLLKAIIEN